MVLGCSQPTKVPATFDLEPDRTISGTSKLPIAEDVAKVGTYSASAKAGGGFFYDDVLEYRVWMSPYEGAPDVDQGSDYYVAFAQYERALEFSRKNKGTEEPLVLVRQKEWIDEPQPGKYVQEKSERVSEWQVQWLEGRQRKPESISEFLKHPKRTAVSPTEKKD